MLKRCRLPRARPALAIAVSVALAGLALGLPVRAQGPAHPPEPAAHQRVDDVAPRQHTQLLLFGRPLTLWGSWEGTAEHRGNLDLNDARARQRVVLEHELKLRAHLALAPQHTLHLELVGLHETRRTQGSADTRTHALERGPAWWQWDGLAEGTTLQLGRLPWVERRAWWWDEDLDGLRLQHRSAAWRHEFGLAREVARHSSAQRRIDPADQGVWRALWQARFKPEDGDHTLEGFGLAQHDRSGTPRPGTVWAQAEDPDVEDLRAQWLGLRASGRLRPGGTRLDYWLDTAWLHGRARRTEWSDDSAPVAGPATGQRLRGNAVDAGLSWRAGPAWAPAFSVGWASGSPGFRQTGLHENKARVAGAKRAQVYGEVLQAELANLSVASVGLAWRMQQNSSVELFWRQFQQRRASESLRDSRLSQAPTGLNPRLGQEWSAVLAWREWPGLELVLRGGQFRPGPAFAPNRRDPARSVELGATVAF